MKNKSALSLVEQCVILLVFAWAAAMCLQAFVWANNTAKDIQDRDTAVICAQNAAEELKASRGQQVAQGDWIIHYDENWNVADQADTYVLTAMRWPPLSDDEGLARGVVFVERADGEVLFKLQATWQEVMGA